ncbi:MAG: PAS domain S-box protein [Ilumatobacteraceae bacterium]
MSASADLLAELATDVVGRVSVDGHFESVSPSVHTVLGWAPDEVVGRPMFDFIDPADLRAAGLTAGEALGGREVDIEARVITRDGGRRWMSVLLRPVRDEHDHIVGRISGWRDVHDAHQARVALADREAQYRLLAEHSSDVVVQVDNHGIVRWVSPSITERLGWLPHEMVGRTNDHLLHPDDRVRLQEARSRAGHGEYPEGSFEVRYMARDGKYVWLSVRARPIRDELGNITGMISSWRDVDEEHRVRERLRQSEERMRLLVENATDVVLQADRDGVIEWISESVRHMLGRSSWEMIGSPVADHVHPDDLPVLAQAQSDVNGGRDARFEMRVFTADGDVRWMSSVTRPLFSPTGTVIGRVAGWRSIDAERSVRERLRESEERLRFVLDNITDVVIQQIDGIPVYVSSAITGILGWQPEDLVGRQLTDFWHPEDRGMAVTLREQSMRGDGGQQVMRMRHKNGSYRWIEASGQPAPAPDGRPGAVGLLRDVTERVEAAHALAEAQERDRLMAELSSDVFLIYASDGTIVWANGATQQIVGVPPEELLGTPGDDLFFEDDRARTAAQRTVMHGGELITGHIRIRRPNGEAHWVDRRMRAIVDEHGNVRFYATSWRDAQAEVEYSERLTASEREAKEANTAKTAFLSRMSHELRTPLNAVLGFGQLLEMDDLPTGQHQAVEQILTGGRHLLELINEVLDIARIESGRMSMSLEAVMVSDLVGQAIELVRPLGDAHQVTLPHFDPTACDTLVFVDRQRTIQVLLNLLSNAIKYNTTGGAVRVVCRELDVDCVAIDVEDDGLGIAPELLPRLFEPFDRLGAEASGIEGTGIGLALSRGLAEMMHGRIEVRSTPHVGSVFTLVLPRTVAVPMSVDTTDGVSGAPADANVGRVVLYVEDNPANAMLMRSIVERREGVELREASTGESALGWALADVPDLVLLDLHLPDIPGEEVLRRLRTDQRTATVPVVVISADAAQDVRGRLGALGADAFIPKPVDLGEVLSWIDDPLQGRRASST